MSVILETRQLCKFYGAGENQVKAVNQVDIQIEQGEFVAIVGKSGSGKSHYFICLEGLIPRQRQSYFSGERFIQDEGRLPLP